LLLPSLSGVLLLPDFAVLFRRDFVMAAIAFLLGLEFAALKTR
jgi:hypothetical protein